MIEIGRLVPVVGEMFFADSKKSFDELDRNIDWKCNFADERIVIGIVRGGGKVKSFLIAETSFTPISNNNSFFGDQVLNDVINSEKFKSLLLCDLPILWKEIFRLRNKLLELGVTEPEFKPDFEYQKVGNKKEVD